MSTSADAINPGPADRESADADSTNLAARAGAKRPNHSPPIEPRTNRAEPPDRSTEGLPPAGPRASTGTATAAPRSAKAPAQERADADSNSMRSEGEAAAKRGAIPPLEDRFNVKRTGLVEKQYHFRDQAGKVAFTDKLMSISTATESPAAIKAMVDRAAERGWETVRLSGSPEFARQGWIAATAQGLKAVGHTPTAGDRDAATKEQARLQVGHPALAPEGRGTPIRQAPEGLRERASRGDVVAVAGQRQVATAIEKALNEGRVSPNLRVQVRALMADEVALRMVRGEQLKVPVYDSLAPRARPKTLGAMPQRTSDRERSR